MSALPASAVLDRCVDAVANAKAAFEQEASSYVIEPSSFGIVRSVLDSAMQAISVDLRNYMAQGGGPHGSPERCAELALQLAQDAQDMVARTLKWSDSDRFGLKSIVVAVGGYVEDKVATVAKAGSFGVGLAVVLLLAVYLLGAPRRLA